MKDVFLSRGSHETPFDKKGNPTLCAQEYIAWVAGEPHSDSPKCVSPVLNFFTMSYNDALDDETRQRLRPYLVRQIGTAGDGQDEVRSFLALDWLIRIHTPAFLDMAGLTEEATALRKLEEIKSIEKMQAAQPQVLAAKEAAAEASWEVVEDDAKVARQASKEAARDAALEVAEKATCCVAMNAAWAAIWAGTLDAVRAATWSVTRAISRKGSRDASRAAAQAASRVAATALIPTVVMLQESAFDLLDRMIDPTGIHDIKDEQELLQNTERKVKWANQL